jgi:3-oxoacyl-(acyl-carrier-protein) synthase
LLHDPQLNLQDLPESSYQFAPEVTTKAAADFVALLAGILGAISTLSTHCQSSGTQRSQSMLLSHE